MGTTVNTVIEKANSNVRELGFSTKPYINHGSRFLVSIKVLFMLIVIPGILLGAMLLLGATINIPKSAIFLVFTIEIISGVAMVFLTKPVYEKWNKLKSQNTHDGYLHVDITNEQINLMSPLDVSSTDIDLRRISEAHFHSTEDELKLLMYLKTKYRVLSGIVGDTEHVIFLDKESYAWLQTYFEENNVEIIRFKNGEVI